jgi:hypothetical protein
MAYWPVLLYTGVMFVTRHPSASLLSAAALGFLTMAALMLGLST